MKTSAVPNVVSALTARTQFGQIIRRVKEKNERFVVDRRGEPQAVIMSIKDYLDTIAPAPAWLTQSWATAKRSGVAKMSMRDIDGEIRRNRREKEKKSRSR
jgi:prevent-host-death family protein